MSKYTWTQGDVSITYEASKWYSSENVKIIDSYLIKDDAIKFAFIDSIKDDGLLLERSYESLIREWKAHNILYKFGLFKTKTKDTDLEENECWLRRFGYFIITLIFKE